MSDLLMYNRYILSKYMHSMIFAAVKYLTFTIQEEKRMKKMISILSVLCLVAMTFTGCGSKEDKVKIASADDLKGLTIAVQQGTIGNDLADEIVKSDSATKVSAFTKYIDAITSLKQKKADAVIMDGAPAAYFVEQNTDLMVMEEPMTTEQYAIAIKKGNSEVLNAVNATLAAMKADGSLEAIILKYQKDASEVKSIDLNESATGGTLTMGTETGFAPYEYKEGDAIYGIDVEIAAAVAKKMNKKLVITDMDFDALIPALASSKIDMIAAGMTVTDERKQSVDFSDAYIDAAQVIVIRKTSLAK